MTFVTLLIVKKVNEMEIIENFVTIKITNHIYKLLLFFFTGEYSPWTTKKKRYKPRRIDEEIEKELEELMVISGIVQLYIAI